MKCSRNRFQITSRHPIANGASGNVFYGIDTLHNREIAIKKLKDKKLAYKEFNIMEGYGTHHNLPQAFGLWQESSYFNIAMELIKGEKLGHHLFGEKTNQDIAKQILINLLNGLERLHNRGYLHLDIQPQNIMLTDDLNFTKLIDFGVSEQKEIDGLWIGKSKGGTWEYSPPEQDNLSNPIVILDNSTDTYNVAGIGIYLITGKAPILQGFNESNHPLKEITSPEEYRKECIRLREKFPERSPKSDLERILYKGLNPESSIRFQSTRDFRSELERLQ